MVKQSRSLVVKFLTGLINLVAVAITVFAGAGCADRQAAAYPLGVLYTGDTRAYMEPCGCCGGQMGGLPARATYLVQYQERIERKRQGLPPELTGTEAAPAAPIPPDSATEQVKPETDPQAPAGLPPAAVPPGSIAPPESGAPSASEAPSASPPAPETDSAGAPPAAPAPPPATPAPPAAPAKRLFVPDDYLLLDFGGFCDNASESKVIQSVYTAQALEQMQYDVVNLGTREVQMTGAQLKRVLEKFEQTALVTANIGFEKRALQADAVWLKQKVQPFRRVTIGACRFFITGVVTQGEPQAEAIARELGYTIGDPLAALKPVLGKAKRGEYVIVLADGLSKDEVEAINNSELIQRIDLLVGVPNKLATPYSSVQSGTADRLALGCGLDRGRSIGRAELVLDNQGRFAVEDIAQDNLPKDMQRHPLMVELIKQMTAQVTEVQRAEQEKLRAVDLSTVVDYMGSPACLPCHPEICQEYQQARHATALRTLGERGEERNPLCLPCHTTGYGEVTGFSLGQQASALGAVGCEACHGPGETHVLRHRAEQGAATAASPGAAPTPAEAAPAVSAPPPVSQPIVDTGTASGLRPVSKDTCLKCHDENTDPNFSYETKLPFILHNRNQ